MGSNTDDLGAIDVSALIKQVRLSEPLGTVTVQGTVQELRQSHINPAVVYGDLRGLDKSTISFECSIASGIRTDDHVVLRGTLSLKHSKPHRGYKLELTGSRVGTWTPHEAPVINQVALTRSQRKLLLERFIAEGTEKKLVLIGTDIGVKDVLATLSLNAGQMPETIVTKPGLANLQAAIVAAAKTCDGVCLVRGGGDPDTFRTLNDRRLIDILLRSGKHFYTALGHAADLTWADIYADEVFVAPSDLSGAITNAWRARAEQRQKDKRLNDLDQEIRKLNAEKASAKRTEWDRKMLSLQTTLDRFKQLPSVLRAQTGQAVTAAIKTSMQDDFKRPLADAIQGPIANLTYVTEQARGVLAKTIKELRLHAWTWLLSVFLLGAFVGAYCFYSLERSTLFETRHESPGSQQAVPSEVKPPEVKAGSGRRGH